MRLDSSVWGPWVESAWLTQLTHGEGERFQKLFGLTMLILRKP